MTRRAIVKHSAVRLLLRRAGPPAALLIVVLFFGAYAVIGPNGALAYGEIKQRLAERQSKLAELQAKRAVLENQVRLLDPRHVDPDMSDELVRKELNVVGSNEVVVPLN